MQKNRVPLFARATADRHWLSVATEWEDLVKLIAGTESKSIESSDSANLPPVTPDEGTFAPAYRPLRKLNSYEGQPHLLLEIYLDSAVYNRAAEEFESGPIIPVLNKLPRLRIGTANESLTVGVADPEVAKLFGIAVGAPVVEVRRIIRHMDSTML
jgi:GntR family transcriptional regulator